MKAKLTRGLLLLVALVILALLGDYAVHVVQAWQRSHAIGRNRVINGDFDRWAAQGPITVDYRTSKITAIGWLATADGAGGRGRIELSRGVLNVYGKPPLPFLRWNQLSGATAGAPSLAQTIPGVATLAGRQAVLSLYARSDTPLPMVAILVQSFGTSSRGQVTPDRTVAALRFTTDTHWTAYALPVSLPAIKNVSLGDPGTDVLRLAFLPDRPKLTFTLEMTQVQLESGRTPTPFEPRQPVRRPSP